MLKIMVAVLVGLLVAGDGYAQTYTGGGGGAKAKPGMVLPDTIYVATDREMNIYAAHLPTLTPLASSSNTATAATAVAGSSPFVFDFKSRAGTMMNRSYRWTPAAAKDSLLTIDAYDYSGKKVETNSVVLRAISKASGTGLQKTLFVGDSFFDGTAAYLIAQVDSLFSTQGGGNIMPIGTQTTDGYKHESHSGKNWNYFTTNPSGPFWFNGRLDFRSYISSNSLFGPIELVVVNLGGNTAFTDFATGRGRAMTAADVDTAVIDLAKAFVDTMMNATYGYPNAHIVFNIMPAPSALMSGYGGNYGGALNSAYVNYQKSMREIAKQMIATFDGGAYDRHADVCYGGLWLDNVLGYGADASNSAAFRIADNEIRSTNFLHPEADGYYQIADALFSHMKYTHTLTDCRNNLADSYRFTNATYWGSVATYYTPTTGQADPWGGTTATLFTATASVVSGAFVATTATNIGTITADNVVVSAFYKNGNLGTSDKSTLRLYSVATGTTTEATITWTATPSVAAGAGAGAVGLIALGGGWYQVWLYKDLSAIDDTGFSVRCDLDQVTPLQNDTMYLAGVQLEYGVTTPCGTYVIKP